MSVHRWTGWCRRWAAGLVALSAVVVVGCSAEKHYKVLSFFFDGVPDPNAPATPLDSPLRQTASGVVRTVYEHKPVKEGKCAQCHGGGAESLGGMEPVAQDVCLKCHASVLQAYPWTHGPVILKLCQLCHNAHESEQPYLLKRPAAQLCGGCHEPLLLGPKPPEHMIADVDCTRCHSGHGGVNHFMLKPTTRPASTAPSTAPTATPPLRLQQTKGGVEG